MGVTCKISRTVPGTLQVLNKKQHFFLPPAAPLRATQLPTLFILSRVTFPAPALPPSSWNLQISFSVPWEQCCASLQVPRTASRPLCLSSPPHLFLSATVVIIVTTGCFRGGGDLRILSTPLMHQNWQLNAKRPGDKASGACVRPASPTVGALVPFSLFVGAG